VKAQQSSAPYRLPAPCSPSLGLRSTSSSTTWPVFLDQSQPADMLHAALLKNKCNRKGNFPILFPCHLDPYFLSFSCHKTCQNFLYWCLWYSFFFFQLKLILQLWKSVEHIIDLSFINWVIIYRDVIRAIGRDFCSRIWQIYAFGVLQTFNSFSPPFFPRFLLSQSASAASLPFSTIWTCWGKQTH
jgi:hypothetical protein